MSTVSPRRQERPSPLWPRLTPRRVVRLIDQLRHRASPNHWSFLFGVVSLACLVVLTVTGVILMFFYDPSSATVTYRGSYPLLRGVEMSEAFASTLRISFDVGGGLLVRQAHHWAALVLPAALVLQLLATFFTGAFRRPRQWSWLLLFGIFLLALAAGWSGYALPDDMLSGTGLRIAQGVALGIPVLGTPVAWFLFGGEFPGRIIPTLYGIHLRRPGRAGGPAGRPAPAVLAAAAAPVPRPRPYRGQRGRGPGLADGGDQGHRPVLPHRRGADPDGRDPDDQPGLAVRAGRPRRGERRQPAGLVHRLPRRGAPAGAGRLGGRLAGTDLDPRRPRPAGRRRSLPGPGGRLSLPGEPDPPRPQRAPPARPTPRHPHPDRRSGPPASRSTAPCGRRAAPT